MREEVGCIDGVFFGVSRSELEGRIKQFIERATVDNIFGDVVRLQERWTR